MDKKTSWDQVYGSMVEQVNKVGADQGFQVCFSNDSSNDGKVGAMWTYDNNTAEKLKEQMRPVSCLDTCVLF